MDKAISFMHHNTMSSGGEGLLIEVNISDTDLKNIDAYFHPIIKKQLCQTYGRRRV